jgi:hypothetical protein
MGSRDAASMEEDHQVEETTTSVEGWLRQTVSDERDINLVKLFKYNW